MGETYQVDYIFYRIEGDNAIVTGCATESPDDPQTPSSLKGIIANTLAPSSVSTIQVVTLTIPSIVEISGTSYPVTSIGNGAFINRTDLTVIIIPDSVTNIRDNAFSGCSSLISVIMGNSVTTIGDSAFSGCISLVTLTIPYSVTTIGANGFLNCSGLTSIIIPNLNTIVGINSFNGCTSLARFYKI
jgi:hypothetical protein